MSEVNQSDDNGSAGTGAITTAEITGHDASTRGHVKHLQKLAAAAVEAVQGLASGVRLLDEHLATEPTAKQNATFIAWFEAELSSGGEYDRQREAELLQLWRKLHPGTLPGIVLNPHDDECPF